MYINEKWFFVFKIQQAYQAVILSYVTEIVLGRVIGGNTRGYNKA